MMPGRIGRDQGVRNEEESTITKIPCEYFIRFGFRSQKETGEVVNSDRKESGLYNSGDGCILQRT